MAHQFRLKNQGERVDREIAANFMLHGKPGDQLIAIGDRVAGEWVDHDVLVTRIHPSSAVGFGLLDYKRQDIVWINLDYDTPIPTAAEVRLMVALRGLQA